MNGKVRTIPRFRRGDDPQPRFVRGNKPPAPVTKTPEPLLEVQPFIPSHSNLHIQIKRQSAKPAEPEQPFISPPSKAALMARR